MTAERKMTIRRTLSAFAVAVACLFLTPIGGNARIPEPDNLIYGTVAEGVDVVSLKVDGQEITAYTVGSNPTADGYYLLRVPMDAFDPQEPGTARSGDVAYIYINDDLGTPFTSVVLGARGNVYEVPIDPGDTDNDGLPDDWEQQIVDADTNDGVAGIVDVDPNGDFDNDGESNLAELNNGTDPTDPMSARRGDMNGDGFITMADAVTALKILSGMDVTPGPIPFSEVDVNGDEKCGVGDVFFVLARIAKLR